VAVAVETEVPDSWYDSPDAKPARVRVAVIGHGGPFLGTSLNPLQEKLLLDTCNWLLGRDDRLARTHDDEGNPIPQWRYPRGGVGAGGVRGVEVGRGGGPAGAVVLLGLGGVVGGADAVRGALGAFRRGWGRWFGFQILKIFAGMGFLPQGPTGFCDEGDVR